MAQVTEEEFKLWLEDPVTKLLRLYAATERMRLMESWATGGQTSESADGTAQLNAQAIGKCVAYMDIAQINWTDIQKAQESDE
jgi:hypothetical protein